MPGLDKLERSDSIHFVMHINPITCDINTHGIVMVFYCGHSLPPISGLTHRHFEKISKKFACSLFWGVNYKYTKNIPDFQILLRDNYFLLSMLSIIPYSRASRDVIQ